MARTTAWLALSLSLLLGACTHSGAPASATAARARFFLEAPGDARAEWIVLPQSGVRIALGPRPVLTEFDLAVVRLAEVEFGRGLLFEFTPAAARALERMASDHVGRRLVLLVDDEPIGVRVLNGPLVEGRLLMLLERPDRELPPLADRLNRGVRELATRLNQP